MSLDQQIPELHACMLDARDRGAVLEAAAQQLSCEQANAGELRASLQARERLCSTAIGHGIAIPHGRVQGLDAPRGVLLRLQHAVDFNADDGERVDLVFAMAVPDHYTQQHLLLLSELAERFSSPQLRAALRSARDPAAMRAILLHTAPAPQTAA